MSISGESAFLDLIKEDLAEGICIDIGANLGDYTALLLARGAQTVHCFEPHKELCAHMEARFKKEAEKIRILPMAIGEEEKEAILYFKADALAHSSLMESINDLDYVSNLSRKKTRVTTVDRHLNEWPDSVISVVKIDVEGSEIEVLRGACETIRVKRPKFIQVELNQHQLIRGGSLYEFSKLLPGYRCFQMTPRGLVMRNPLNYLSNIFAYSNFVFVRDDMNQNFVK